MWQPVGWGVNQEEDFTIMANKNLIIEDQEYGIRLIKINRPQALNALNSETIGELKRVLEETQSNSEVRVVVLTGEGDKAFIAGADIKAMKDLSPEQGIEFARSGQAVTALLETLPQPTIAAVNGFALGGGTELAIACDFIIASENAVFGSPEVGLGIIPGFGGTIRLARFVGWPLAKELIFSGRKVKAQEAKQCGLANQVYPQADLMTEVLSLATKISRQSFMAVSKAKKLMADFSEAGQLEQKLETEAKLFGEIFGHPDQREGMEAFIEKRKPKFEGIDR